MIVKVDRGSHHREQFVICLRETYDLNSVLKAAKAKRGTYAGEIVSDVFAAVFDLSIELKADYLKYFSLEYPTFGEYVRKRFLWPDEVADQVVAANSDCVSILLFEPRHGFIDEEYGPVFLRKLLSRGKDR